MKSGNVLLQDFKVIFNGRNWTGTEYNPGTGIEHIQFFLEKLSPQANKELLNSPVDDVGNTPLHIAAMEGNTPLAKLLIEYGADLTALNKQEKTPEIMAKEAKISNIGRFFNAIGISDYPDTEEVSRYLENERLKKSLTSINQVDIGAEALELTANAINALDREEIFSPSINDDNFNIKGTESPKTVVEVEKISRPGNDPVRPEKQNVANLINQFELKTKNIGNEFLAKKNKIEGKHGVWSGMTMPEIQEAQLKWAENPAKRAALGKDGKITFVGATEIRSSNTPSVASSGDATPKIKR